MSTRTMDYGPWTMDPDPAGRPAGPRATAPAVFDARTPSGRSQFSELQRIAEPVCAEVHCLSRLRDPWSIVP